MTTSPSQVELVTLAVFLLGGAERPVDTEDVAIKAAELGPGRFSWRKYPDRINLELVRVYLSAAKKEENGSLVAGSGRRGWSLTAGGLRWAREEAETLLRGDLSRSTADAGVRSIDRERQLRERKRIEGTAAWISWREDPAAVRVRDAAEVFRIDSYADRRLRNIKVNRLLRLFHDDPALQAFLEHMAHIVEQDGE